ncbi:MYO1A-like protein [Mya arenaria]|uniref:MYO1A-like protein n=1 Tax=Mya arenaria TaxID=6604 RepID=A0ABY7E8T9_MYAAR|nr:MYO1A-like protein [Mya arenaria]
MALHKGALAIFENNVGVSDCVLLDPVTEDAFIENIKARFKHDQIYTYIGTVVVSVNPYRKLPLYTTDIMEEYAISDMAYRSMRDRDLDQCIIISGEKASKVIMQYVAQVSGKGREIDRVKEQLLQSNPVLEVVKEVSELVRCIETNLTSALTQRTVEVKREKVKTDFSVSGANYARDALCKAIYSRLFTWLVQRINDSIKVKGDLAVKAKVMGVLDIYGFENTVGILALLDEHCLMPGNITDMTFLEKLNLSCKDHPHYESRKLRKNQNDRTLPHDAFRLKHYAGSVTYKVDGFLDKNNDLLYRDLSQAMFNCKHALLRKLFPEGCAASTIKGGNPAQKSLKRPPTAGSQFKVSVQALMKNLLTKCPNYIRCIKPNDEKQSGQLDMDIVRHQVRYLGLLENIRVKRAGYAFRQVYGAFLYRYKMLADATWPSWSGNAVEGVREIITYQNIQEDEIAYGKSKLFIRNPRTLFDMEERRREKMHYLATLIQKVWKGHARKVLAALKYEKRVLWAVGIIRKYFLGWKIRQQYKPKFRRIAGPKIARFFVVALCRKYRRKLSEAQKYRLREKLTASDTFKGKKACYTESVPQVFKGDYLNVQGDMKWRKIAALTKEMNVVFADFVHKVNRQNGKVVPHLLVVSMQAMLVIDHQTMTLKYRIPIEYIESASLSPYQDKLAVIHMKKPENGDTSAKKGDFVLGNEHIIELVTKLCLCVKNVTNRMPAVNIAAQCQSQFGHASVQVSFQEGLKVM